MSVEGFGRRALRGYLGLVMGLIFLLAAMLSIYGFAIFRPSYQEMREVLRAVEVEDQPPSFSVHMLESGRGTHWVTRYIATRFLNLRYPTLEALPLQRPADQILWSFFVEVLFSEEEIARLYCAIAWNGQSEGLGPLSRRLFSKAPQDLTPEEFALALAVFEWPQLLERERPKLEERASRILSEYQQGVGSAN